MTVGELIDRLGVYDKDRPVITSSKSGASSYLVHHVASVEPGGPVVIIEEGRGQPFAGLADAVEESA